MLFVMVMLACGGSKDAPPSDTNDTPTRPPPTVEPTTDTTTDTGKTTAPTADTSPPTADTAPVIDCTIDRPLPVTWQTFSGFGKGEDFDINLAGEHVSVTGGDLIARTPGAGQRVVTPNVGYSTAGTRVMVDGNYIVASVSDGTMVRVDGVTGAKDTVLTGMQYPNGVDVGRDGYVFVADQSRRAVVQFNPDTGDQYIIATDLSEPNGVILTDDEQSLYVGSFGGGKVYRIDRLSDTEWDAPVVVVNSPGPDGGFDGINVDICGNVYFTEYIQGKVWRISVNTGSVELAADLPSSWIPNMRWGHDQYSWDSHILYVADRDQGRLFALDMGLPGKRHVQLP